MERELFAFILGHYPDAQNRVKGLLASKRFEIDIYVPSLRCAIEYDGEHWHSTAEATKRDARKAKECLDVGIKLLRVRHRQYRKRPRKIRTWLLDELRALVA
jgi:very-short-patch-repair endonuclease